MRHAPQLLRSLAAASQRSPLFHHTGRFPAVPALLLLLTLTGGLAGCHHKQQPTPPPAATAPPLPPTSMTHQEQLPSVPAATIPQVGAPGSDQKPAVASAPPPPPHKRKSKKKPDAADTTPAVAAGGAPAPAPTPAPAPAQPSLGQLSAGNGASAPERAAMTEEIRQQQSRIDSVKKPLSSDGEATLLQVRAFLAKARQAVEDNDLDGARTLTTKAKLLLDELSGS